MHLAPSAAGATLPFTLTPILERDDAPVQPHAARLRQRRRPRRRSRRARAQSPPHQLLHRPLRQLRSDAAVGRRARRAPRSGEHPRLQRRPERLHLRRVRAATSTSSIAHTGARLRTFALPAEFAVTQLSPQGDVEIAGNTVGRVANKGMEGLAISPDGRLLFGAMQSPLLQDGGTNGALHAHRHHRDLQRRGAPVRVRAHQHRHRQEAEVPDGERRSWPSTVTSSSSTSATARAAATTRPPSTRSSIASTSPAPST